MNEDSIKSKEDVIKGFVTKVLDIVLEDPSIFDVLTLNCISCRYFNKETDVCGVYKQRPPARIIVRGCDQHSEVMPF